MNILPKKSWHVRNKDNVAKVREDEENARLQAKEQSRRGALAEQEARTNYLREKARARAVENSADLKELLDPKIALGLRNAVSTALSTAASTSRPPEISSSMKNEEHEKEKKEEQVKYEKKVGLLTYLGQSAAETMEDCEKPWYFKPPKRKSRIQKSSSSEDEVREKDLKRKASMDPMHAMKSHLHKKKVSDKLLKKHKKHKRKHKHHKVSSEKEMTLRGSDKLAKLREERLRREKKERERAAALLNGGETSTEGQTRQYNSQFNPHLARTKTYSKYGGHRY